MGWRLPYRKALAFGLLIAFLPTGPSAETEEERTRAQLEKLRSDMASLSQARAADLKQRDTLRSALRESEVAIGNIRRDIGKTRERLEWSQDKLKSLRSQRRELLVARGEQQELITREIRTAYQMGKQGQLKVLLQQESPHTLARAMTYYDYFYQARQEHIRDYLETISRIDTLETDISNTTQQLERTRKTLSGQEQRLLARKKQREQDLKNLNASIASKDQRLEKLRLDQEELERLLEVIEQAIAALEVPQEYQDFTSFKGQMPWPVAGKPNNRYGGRRSDSQQRWQGLVIPSDEGGNVTAIHHGRVVFADWFRGSGLLIIVDHGEGYMSLYARNQALLREVGEWVSAGAPIATVGNSGGQRETALYFEIRHNGKPINPGPWLGRG